MTTPVWTNPLALTDLVDWGVIPTMIEGESRTSGKLLHKGPEGRSECGLWVCTPGKWACHVTRDEFCHFLEGRCTYVHEMRRGDRDRARHRRLLPRRTGRASARSTRRSRRST